MSITLDEWRHLQPARKPSRRQPDPASTQQMAQDAVRADALTHDENWDWFARYLQAGLNAAHRDLEFRKAALCDPLLVNDDLVRQHRAMISVISARIEALDEILRLPKRLLERGQDARRLVEEMERDAA